MTFTDHAQSSLHAARSARFHLDLEGLTVYSEDENGELYDLNAEGRPIETLGALASFIEEVERLNGISGSVAEEMLEEVRSHM
jgi:hypothetical protein